MDGHRGLLFNLLAEFVLRGVMLNGGHYFSPASALGQPFMVWSKNKVKLNALIDLDRGPSTIACVRGRPMQLALMSLRISPSECCPTSRLRERLLEVPYARRPAPWQPPPEIQLRTATRLSGLSLLEGSTTSRRRLSSCAMLSFMECVQHSLTETYALTARLLQIENAQPQPVNSWHR
jgi:hypothetical protein